jgi:hypothetical protein
MSFKTLKRDVKEHSQELQRQKINLTYGTMCSVTTNGTLIRPINDPFTSSIQSQTSGNRWA